MGQVFFESSARVSLVEHNDVVKALTLNRTNGPLRVSGFTTVNGARSDSPQYPITTRGAGTARHKAHRVIAKQITRCAIEWEHLAELPCHPLRAGMFGNIEMHNVTTNVLKHDEYVQDAKCHSRYRERINGGNAISVVHEPSARKARQR
ncbi:MAG: hypothetical protein ACI8PT_000747 [Gammaproteobacteria bacterium]